MKYLKRFNESLDNDISSYIKDILLDLEDKGIHTFIVPSEGNFSISISSIDLNRHDFSQSTPFMISNDIWASLEHLNNYLDDMNYRLSTISFTAKDSDDKKQNDGADDLDDFKRLVGIWGYDSFESIILKYKKK